MVRPGNNPALQSLVEDYARAAAAAASMPLEEKAWRGNCFGPVGIFGFKPFAEGASAKQNKRNRKLKVPLFMVVVGKHVLHVCCLLWFSG